ncbi:MAG: hypothetical protein K6B68_02385, partial [Eubacterium sp.]|nr:hypothetical protein [Eubacterium sp.]
LLNIMLYCSGFDSYDNFFADNTGVECEYFKRSTKLIVLNNTGESIDTKIKIYDGERSVSLEPYDMKKIQL